MPAIITPPETERRRRDTEDGDHGGGRRPPTDKQTGGGGDPDNWNGGRRGPRSPRERLDRFRLGLFFALSAVFMFFVAIVSVFFVSQSSGHFDANARFINEWLPVALPPILWINTALLLLSSLTIEIGRRHMFREMHVMDEWLGLGKPISRRAMPWVATTMVLGALFLAGQVLAWKQLQAGRPVSAGNPSLHSFYLITGIHGAHLLVGVLALAGAFIGLFVSKQIENRQIFVDLAAWYWHSMGLLWFNALWVAGLVSVRRLLFWVVVFGAVSGGASGQGCSQCKESIGQTPARTQQAYRRGIEVLVVAASLLCGLHFW